MELRRSRNLEVPSFLEPVAELAEGPTSYILYRTSHFEVLLWLERVESCEVSSSSRSLSFRSLRFQDAPSTRAVGLRAYLLTGR